MGRATVNIIVEIDGKTYKASNGVNVGGEVFKNDVLNLIDFSTKQIVSESGLRDISEGAKTRVVIGDYISAQDAHEGHDD